MQLLVRGFLRGFDREVSGRQKEGGTETVDQVLCNFNTVITLFDLDRIVWTVVGRGEDGQYFQESMDQPGTIANHAPWKGVNRLVGQIHVHQVYSLGMRQVP